MKRDRKTSASFSQEDILASHNGKMLSIVAAVTLAEANLTVLSVEQCKQIHSIIGGGMWHPDALKVATGLAIQKLRIPGIFGHDSYLFSEKRFAIAMNDYINWFRARR